MSARLRVGILSAAHVPAPAYLAILGADPTVTLAGVWDADPALAAERAAPAGTTAPPPIAALLAASDAVVIAGTNREHRALAEAAAAAGVHVLCEKPLALTVADAEAIVAACASAGVTLMTAFPSPWNMVVAAFTASVREGRVGELVALEGTNTGEMPDVHGAWFTDPELAGGGALVDHVVHLADLYRRIVGAEVAEVYAVTNRILQEGFDRVETGGLVQLRFANGVFATIDCSWSRPRSWPTWGGLTIEALGTAGALAMDAFRQRSAVWGRAADGASWRWFGSDANAAMLADFLDAIRAGRAPTVTGADGVRATEIVAAAYRSAATGAPVRIGEGDAG
ncbi:MAG: Gfo/Idh/MocA family protein [Chloroflexota bacterium]